MPTYGLYIVDSISKNGNTANLCLIDLSSAFDRVNHHGLYLKLMKRRIPNELLIVLQNWLSSCDACFKWKEVVPMVRGKSEFSRGLLPTAK